MEYIVDVETKHKKKLIGRLSKLKTTISCQDGGEYHEDRAYSQVWVETSWTEVQLDDWLYKTKGIDYIGVCEKVVDFLKVI